MPARHLTLLLVLTVAIVAAAVLVGRDPGPGHGDAVDEPALPGLRERLNDVVAIHVDTAGETRAVTLERSDERWTVAERDGYPADAVKVRRLVLDLADLAVRERKTADPARYAEIGVQDLDAADAEGTRITLVLPGGALALIAGKPAGSRGTYVRGPGEAVSAMVEPAIHVDRDPRLWLDRTLLRIPGERWRSVEVRRHGQRPYTVAREDPGSAEFELVGPPADTRRDATAGNALAQAVAALDFEDVRRGPAGAAGDVVSTVTYLSFDGLVLSIDGWREGEASWITLRAAQDGGAASEAARAEARSLDARHAGWQYRVPGYIYDGIFRPAGDNPSR